MSAIDQIRRWWSGAATRSLDGDGLVEAGARMAIERFRQAARTVPAYQAILREHGVDAAQIRTRAEFSSRCPVLSKDELFGRFAISDLCANGRIGRLASVLTSSGQGGRFAFGLSTPGQTRHATRSIERAMAQIFATDRYRTLVLNALPMGVRFACRTVTIAETSVREDMVVALAERLSPLYDQTIVVTDPLFCKRILDYGRETGHDWAQLKVHVILGEETFGEAFRRHVAAGFGQDPSSSPRGLIMSSMGIAEVGLNLFFETRETIQLRQLACDEPERLARVLGGWPGRVPPLLFVYDPSRIYVEVVERDASGYGSLVLSTLETPLTLPLLRYRTGDRAKLLNSAAMAAALRDTGLDQPTLPPLPIVAIPGRESDILPDGRMLLDIKDAMYSRSDLAAHLTGALRIETDEGTCTLHLQLGPHRVVDEERFCAALQTCLPPPPSGIQDRVRLWQYDRFPFGQRLDYERKFAYLAKRLDRPSASS